jgi:hypothetical protein
MEKTAVAAKAGAPSFLGTDAARAVALRNLGFVSTMSTGRGAVRSYADISPISFRAECLRAALWASSNGATMPVYVTRLWGVAGPLLKPDPDFAKSRDEKSGEKIEPGEILRETLEEMELIGDVSRLAGGYWLPAPLRVVPLRALHHSLLIGGRPVWALPKELATRLDYSGVTRFVAGTVDGIPSESEESWCRLPREDVDKQSARILGQAELREFDDPEIEFDVYAAGVPGVRGSHDEFQVHRWTGTISALPDGLYLARQKLFRGRAHYAVAEITKGKIVRTGTLDARDGGIRRLMYGIDLLAKCPVRVLVTRDSGSCKFVLSNEVPRAEHRLLTALATLKLPEDGGYYPRVWMSATRYAPQIERVFERLGVRVEARVERLP